ncbi:titin homolog [Anneissia japonica]|uniref:titin homolog n=1 Tax=Anneissia japonica TaxID=1529436 RepID=UPI001425B8D0|nr:titin homolog [Anneissia japonica]
MFSLLPDGSFRIINNIFENLESEGPVEILQFDPHSGKKLSNGRLVVGGWIKRGYQKRKQMDVLKRFTGCTSFCCKSDVEKQSYEYEPFIMWTDDEMNWNLGKNLKIEEAEKNMQIQVTETGDEKRIVVIITSLDAKKVLYEGQSYDYCTTFTKNTKEWKLEMPVVSFAIIDGSLVCASSMERMDDVTSAKEEKESSENARKENSPKTDEPANDRIGTSSLEKPSEDPEVSIKNVQKRSMFGKASAIVAYALSFKSGESSPSTSTQKYKSVPTIEIPSINNDNSTENAMEEGSPETNALSDDKEVIIMENPLEGSMEESSENIKKRRSFSKFTKKVKNKFSTKSKGKSCGSGSTIQSESASLTEESTLNKEESTESTIKEESSATNKQEGDEQITPIKESPGDSKEESSEKVKKWRFANKFTKSKRESSGSKLTKEAEALNIELASNAEVSSSQIQDRSTWEGLWHLEQDKTNDKAIRLRPVKDNIGSLDTTYDFVTILENRSKVQCEQIVPFTCKDKSWFLMIYKTHYINDEEGKQNHSLCTRYHVFSLDTIMGGK